MNTTDPRQFYIHLVSDATGMTLQGVAKACLAQFDHIDPVERFWPLVRTSRQLDRVIRDLREYPGPVLFTLVNQEIRQKLQDACQDLCVPCLPVMDPIIKALSSYLELPSKDIPGLQHTLDDAYFHRIDAVDFAMSFDDGQKIDGIEKADVILVGVSRTSKTPTCIYLARRGIMAANIPYVPGIGFPDKILNAKGPVIIGLTESPDRLMSIRRNRLRREGGHIGAENAYLDPVKIEEEVKESRRFFNRQGWPVIDVTQRSVEETAAEIQLILQRRRGRPLSETVKQA